MQNNFVTAQQFLYLCGLNFNVCTSHTHTHTHTHTQDIYVFRMISKLERHYFPNSINWLNFVIQTKVVVLVVVKRRKTGSFEC